MIQPTPPHVHDALRAIAHVRQVLATLELTTHERDALADAVTALYEVAWRYLHTNQEQRP